MINAPVFIVGVPRSGTTLLAAMLAAHSRMSCGPETDFFRRLVKAAEERAISPESLTEVDTWPGPALDFICSITYTSFSGEERRRLTDKYQLDEAQIKSFLEYREPSIPAILSSVTQLYMERMGKFRWVEKTPDHLQMVGLIRRYFPDSPVLRIVRDPRDVALSLTKMPWGAQSMMEAFTYWKALDENSAEFFKTDPHSYSLRYEDLIASPKDELIKLCKFLDEPFEESMLDTSSTGKRLNSRNVPWKDKASQPVDPARVSLWKKEFSSGQNQLAEALLGDRLDIYGYPRWVDFSVLGEFYPNRQLALKYAAALPAIAAQGIRFWKIDPGEKPSAIIYLGDPGIEHWFVAEQTKNSHPFKAFFGVLDILKNTLSKKQVYWALDEEIKDWTGFWSFAAKRILRSRKALV